MVPYYRWIYSFVISLDCLAYETSYLTDIFSFWQRFYIFMLGFFLTFILCLQLIWWDSWNVSKFKSRTLNSSLHNCSLNTSVVLYRRLLKLFILTLSFNHIDFSINTSLFAIRLRVLRPVVCLFSFYFLCSSYFS